MRSIAWTMLEFDQRTQDKSTTTRFIPFLFCDQRKVSHSTPFCDALTSTSTICNVLTLGLNAADIGFDNLLTLALKSDNTIPIYMLFFAYLF